MKKEMKAIVVVIIIALVLIVLTNLNKPTGKATLMSGASYGPISSEFDHYIDCVYITEDDEWDITKKTTIQYYNLTNGGPFYSSDYCEDKHMIIEYDCSDMAKKNKRWATCPSNRVCEDGACILEE